MLGQTQNRPMQAKPSHAVDCRKEFIANLPYKNVDLPLLRQWRITH
jgi:hypothetical protein